MKHRSISQRILAALLTIVMLSSVVLPGLPSVPGYAVEEPSAVLDATSGSSILEAENTDFNRENFRYDNYNFTAWDGSKVHLLKHNVKQSDTTIPSSLDASTPADISFTVRTGAAETYYLWMRSAYYNSKTNSVLVSVNNGAYTKKSATHGANTSLTSGQKYGNYGWTLIAVVEGGSEVPVKVNPYNIATNVNYGMVIDSFMVTTSDKAPEASGYYVLSLPKVVTSDSRIAENGSFTFAANNKGFDYKFTATQGKNNDTIAVTDNGDGTYTVSGVTGALNISVACEHENATTSSTEATCIQPGSFTWSCPDCQEGGTKPIVADHTDSNSDHICDVDGCGASVSECEDEDGDKVCDICGGSLIPVLDASTGTGSLDAEDTDYTISAADFSVWDGSTVEVLRNMTISTEVPDTLPTNTAANISFTIRTGAAGTYYLWMRSAYYNSKNNIVLVSVNGGEYTQVAAGHGNNTALNSNPKYGNYGWVRIAVVTAEANADVLIRVNPYTTTKTTYAMAIDSFMVTGTDEAPGAAGYYVLELPAGFASDNGSFVEKDSAFTFRSETGDSSQFCVATVGKDGAPLEVENNGDGTYTTEGVTGAVTVQLEPIDTPRDVTIIVSESGKEDVETNLTGAAVYGTDYTYTLPTADGYVYSITSVLVRGGAYQSYRVENGVLTIPGNAVTGDIQIFLTKKLVPTLDATSGTGSLEAEDTDYTISKGSFSVWNGSSVTVLRNETVSAEIPATLPADTAADISFTIRTGAAGTYYLWMRSAYYNTKTNKVLVSVNGGEYTLVEAGHGGDTQLNYDVQYGCYGWTRIAVVTTEANAEVQIKVNPYTITKKYYAMAIDSFMVTSTDEAPGAAGYYVLDIPDGFECDSVFVEKNGSLVFRNTTGGSDKFCVGAAGNDGVAVNVTNNGDGTYTTGAITRALRILVEPIDAPRDITITIKETGKEDVTTNATGAAVYGTDYTYTLPTADGYVYSITSVSIRGIACQSYHVENGVLTIPGNAVTGNIEIVLTKKIVPILNAASGTGSLEAEDTDYTISKDSFSVWNGSSVTVLRNETVSAEIPATLPADTAADISFTIRTGAAGTYYLWMRSAYYNTKTNKVLVSVNGGEYTLVEAGHGGDTQLTYDVQYGCYGWVKIAVVTTEANAEVQIRVNPYTITKKSYAMAIDSFMVTSTDEAPGAAGYYVLGLPAGFVSDNGCFVEKGSGFTFRSTGDISGYVCVASEGKNSAFVAVTDNGNGVYTAEDVTGALSVVLESTSTPRTVTITVKEDGKDDVVTTVDAAAIYGTDYRYTLPAEAGYIYDISSVTVRGSEYPVTLSDGVLSIPGKDIVGDIQIVLRKLAIPVLNAASGSGVLEAEDTIYSDSTDEIVKQEFVDRIRNNVTVLRLRTEYGAEPADGTTLPYDGAESEISFNVKVGKAGKYYLWIRNACYNVPNSAIWLSIDGGAYKKTSVMHTNSTKLALGAENGLYDWVMVAEIVADEANTVIPVSIKSIRVGKTSYAVAMDKFVVTNQADYTPNYAQPTPDTVAYDVTVPDGCVSSSGVNKVAAGTNFTFEIVDHYYTYSFSATVNGKKVEVTDNGDGTYTVFNVNGPLVISAKKTGIPFDVTVIIKEDDKEDVVLKAKDAVHGTTYAYSLVAETGKVYHIWSVEINGIEYHSYNKNEKQIRINGSDITGDVKITLFKSDVDAVVYKVKVAGNVQYATMSYPRLVTAGRACTLEITPTSGKTYSYAVKGTLGGNTVRPEEIHENGVHTYTISSATGEVIFKITEDLVVNTADGYVEFEAEDAWLDLNALYYDPKEGYEGYKPVIKLVNADNASNGTAVQFRERNIVTTLSRETDPVVRFTVNVDIEETDVSKPISERGTVYYVWARVSVKSAGYATVLISIDGETYFEKKVIPDISYDSTLQNFGWTMIAVTGRLEAGESFDIRIRPKQGYENHGALFDRFVVSSDPTFNPNGELPIVTLPSTYDMPEVTPTVGEHPRVMFTSKDIPQIKEYMNDPANAEALKEFNQLKELNFNGILVESLYGEQLAIIEAKAFDYVINGNEENGREAISAMNNLMATSFNETSYTVLGPILFTAAEVYDWCWNLTDSAQKHELVARSQDVGRRMELGLPPADQGAVTSHGAESQLLRDWLAFAIATYDEYPDIYQFVGGRLFEEYVPVAQYLFKSGVYHQGSQYGPVRFTYSLWAQLLIDRMTNGEVDIYEGAATEVPYQFIYTRRPDGQLFREGDDGTERQSETREWGEITKSLYFYASSLTQDGFFKKEYLRAAAERDFTYQYYGGSLSPVQKLVLNDPTLETEDKAQLPLTRYFDSPEGLMIARTGWDMGLDSPDVLAYMKIGETYTGNHQHADMGNFQIYYKGILASDSGVYPTYGSEHHMYYTKSSIAHNTLSITSSTNPTGVQRMNRFGTDGYLDTTINTLEDLLQEKYVTGEVLGQEFGPDAYTPQYSYISGDIAAAYDENVQEAVRSMIFLPLDDEDHPAAFVVFDRITTSEAGSTKTFMLHTQSAPTINGNVTVIRNTLNGYNGELTNQTLLPYNASISSIGGEGKQYMVGDKNYDADRFDAAVISGEAFEEGWGRVEVSTTTTGANQTDFFLNVMYVNDADQTYELVPAELIENGAVVGAKIFDRIALFNKTKERTDKTITFTVPADADVATYQVNVAGLQAGTWAVTNNGNTQTVVASEDGGIIYFEASAGECTLTWTSADAVKTFTENKPATNDGIDIQVDDMYLYAEVEPEFEGEDILVPVKTLFAAIGGTVEDTSIAYDDLRIILAANEVKTLSGDKLVASTTVVKEKDGEYLVSLSYLMDILDGYVWIRWDEYSSMISIDISQCTATQLRGYYTIYTEEHTNVIPVHRAYQSGSETKATTILNAVDGDTMTRWATRGESGQAWAILDLAKVYKVDQVLISFYKGAERASSFAIEVSVDGINWTRALSHTTASGLSEDFDSYDLKGAEARFIKYVGYGNTADAGTAVWNSVTEMLFIGTPKEGGILMPGFKDQSGLDQTQPGDSDGTNMEPGALLGSFGKIILCIVVPVAILGIGGIVVFLICKKRNKKKVTEQ